MQPTVSVVIPTYNRRALVFRALESVFQQTYRPVQIIVVDDCSTDGTRGVLSGAKFPLPVLVVPLPANVGPGAARNAAILRAAGKYVAFLDSDDLWSPDKLQRQIALLEETPNEETTLAFSQVWIQRKHELFIAPVRANSPGETIADYLFANRGYIATSSVVISTAMAQRILFDPRMRLHEDWDFFIRLEQHGAKFVMVNAPLGMTFDRCAAGRASAPQPILSLKVLDTWRPKISQRAYLSLRARIAPQLRQQAPLRALLYILEAYSRGAISTWFLAALTGRLIHPQLRELAYLIRGRLSRLRLAHRTLVSSRAKCGEENRLSSSRMLFRTSAASGSKAEESSRRFL